MYNPTDWVYIKPRDGLSHSMRNRVWRTINNGCLPSDHNECYARIKVRVCELPQICLFIRQHFKGRRK